MESEGVWSLKISKTVSDTVLEFWKILASGRVILGLGVREVLDLQQGLPDPLASWAELRSVAVRVETRVGPSSAHGP